MLLFSYLGISTHACQLNFLEQFFKSLFAKSFLINQSADFD